MKKFKQIFYPTYLIVVVLVLIIAFNIYDALELFKQWGWFKYFSDLPYMGRDLMVFLCVLMLAEIVAENYHIATLKARRKEQDQLITELKAKLYDKAEDAASKPIEEEKIDEEEKNESDYLE
jgi:uncharacterized protein YqgQ